MVINLFIYLLCFCLLIVHGMLERISINIAFDHLVIANCFTLSFFFMCPGNFYCLLCVYMYEKQSLFVLKDY